MWFARDFRSASRVRWAASGGCAEVRERERWNRGDGILRGCCVCIYTEAQFDFNGDPGEMGEVGVGACIYATLCGRS